MVDDITVPIVDDQFAAFATPLRATRIMASNIPSISNVEKQIEPTTIRVVESKFMSHVLLLELFTDRGIGTMITSDANARIIA